MKPGEEIGQVYVTRKKGGCRFVCAPTHLGWKCGHCLRGNLGPFPRKGDGCKVCRAKVAEVRRRLPEEFGDFHFAHSRAHWAIG